MVVGAVAGRVLGLGDFGTATMGSAGAGLMSGTPVVNLAVPLPGNDAFLFKHLGGVASFDARTGQKRWEIDRFRGGGIRHVTELPGGDLLIGSKWVNTLSGIGDPHHLARVDPNSGTVRWLSSYSVDGWSYEEVHLPTHVEVHGDRLMVHRVHTQVFDLETGDAIYRHLAYPTPSGERGFVVADGVFYAVVHRMLEDPPAFAAFLNSPLPTYVRAVDLADGTVIWESEEQRSSLHGIGVAGPNLLVAGSGEIMGGGDGITAFDRSDGTIRWQSLSFDQPSLRERFSFRDRIEGVFGVSNMIIDGATVFAASATELHALDLSDGSVRFTVDYREKDLGSVHRLHDAGDEIMVISTDGIEVIDRTTGLSTFSPPGGRITDYFFSGDDIFLRRARDPSVVRPAARQVVATARLRPLTTRMYGNLWRGIYMTNDGSSMFLLDDDGNLGRYRLVR